VLDQTLTFFRSLTLWQASRWLLLLNIVQFALSLAVGEWVVHRFQARRVAESPGPIARDELGLVAVCLVLNTSVGIAGWWLWQHGIIVVRPSTLGRTITDVAVLFVAMDFLMYASHRIAHVPPIFLLVHGIHHRYVNPRPLDLFALSPIEVLGFGGLWLFVMWIYPATWAAVLIYLALNLIFGTLGHLGVEPFPRMTRWLGSSTFHAGHHANREVNFGFYTSVWDRLFGTRTEEV
jgi:lathosterol oxidase